MRCIALAQAWCARKGIVYFLTRSCDAVLVRRIQSAGARVLPPLTEADLQTTISCSEQVKPSFVVLDGYDFDADYCHALRTKWRVVVVDDSVRLPRYETDVLLNQNLGAEVLAYNVNREAVLLLGTQYALLRREFADWRERVNGVPDVARRVLVTVGGSDSQNVTRKIVQALRLLEPMRLHARVVLGPANAHFAELRDELHGDSSRIELLRSVTEMAAVMSWADVAVTAGGSTCWELACLGVPALVVVTAPNQTAIAAELHSAGAAVSLGWHDATSSQRIAIALEELLCSRSHRLRMGRQGRALVDGKGAERVVTALWERSNVL